MPGIVALTLLVVAVAVLLRIERRGSPSTSVALWIPTVWMLIAGSRAVGRWMVPTQFAEAIDYGSGSLPDRVALAALICVGLGIVMFRRNIRWSEILRDNAWLWLFFLYMGLSVLWVDDPFVSFKRWIRSAGAVVMALTVLTESRPTQALASLFRRCAYVLLPLSLVLIKYYPRLGRAYGRWNGLEMWTGVAGHRNGLGQLCALSILFLVWSLFRESSSHDEIRPKSRTYADLGVLALALFLLGGPGAAAYSATAISVTVVSVGMFFALRRRRRLAGFMASHLRAVTVVSVSAYLLLADTLTTAVTSLLERDKNLTGRATDIWPVVMEAASRHPILGAGYGGVWGLGGEISALVGVEQAHNGYLDVYLQLGLLGVVLLTAFLLEFCSRIRRQFVEDSDWGVFGIAFLTMTLMYNLTETNFFDVYVGTSLVLLSMVFSARTTAASVAEPLPVKVHPLMSRQGSVPANAPDQSRRAVRSLQPRRSTFLRP